MAGDPNLSNLEKKIIALLQTDIPVTARPYKAMAEQIGISEDRFLETLKGLNDRNMIRRFGATLKHQKSGFTANAMVAWKVAESQVEKTGKVMAGFREITHCYRRDPAPESGWRYNLYTMVHATSEQECRSVVEKIARAAGQDDYELLFSRQELKKTSMKYFED